MAYLNEAGVTALWNKLKKRDITSTSISTTTDGAELDLVYGSGDKASFNLAGASAEAAGLMSAADKTKLDSLAIDSAFSTTSTNAVQNKVISDVINGLYTRMASTISVPGVGSTGYNALTFNQYQAGFHEDGELNLEKNAQAIGTIGFDNSAFYVKFNNYSVDDHAIYVHLYSNQTFTSVKVDTPAAGDSSTLCATTAFVQNAINTAMTGSSSFQGTTKDYTTIANTSYKKGYYWVANAAFTLGSDSIEIGDMIFCISDKGTASATTDFSVVQANLTSIPTTYIDALS